MSTMTLEQAAEKLRLHAEFQASLGGAGELLGPLDILLVADAIDAHITSREAKVDDDWPIRGKVWQRGEEWVLDLEGVYDDQAFYCRHTEPLTTSRADVPGLPSHYPAAQEAAKPVIPEGYVLVPSEPTDEMFAAYQEEMCHWSAMTYVDDDGVYALWKAMIAATQDGDRHE